VASSEQLQRAAETTVERLGVAAGESFVVAYNDELAPVADEVAAAGRRAGAETRAVLFPELTRGGDEPPATVAEALLHADAAALVTTFSLSHTAARLEATRRGARIASMPGITVDMFARTVPVDYSHLESTGRALAALLTGADRCRLVAPGGTEIELDLHGRTGRSDDGDLRQPGAFGNLPAGEGYVAPVESAGDGTIVFDGSLATWGLLEEPVHVDLVRGRAHAATGGGAAAWLLATLDAGGENGRAIAELGIGTNHAATITGLVLEDEKVEGTIHLAFGTNTGIGGENQASVHVDGVIHSPTIELDGRTVMRDGRLEL
jgi:leucyl aminopeptidase (aminopeptidase T)